MLRKPGTLVHRRGPKGPRTEALLMVDAPSRALYGYGVLDHYNGWPVPVRRAGSAGRPWWVGEHDLRLAAGPCAQCQEAQAMLGDYLCRICRDLL